MRAIFLCLRKSAFGFEAHGFIEIQALQFGRHYLSKLTHGARSCRKINLADYSTGGSLLIYNTIINSSNNNDNNLHYHSLSTIIIIIMDNNNTMEYRIGLEKQNKRNDQVTELILDNCRASQISGLTEEFVNLETLSLINVGLVTLKGFPKLPKLKKLELSDNRLTGGLNLLHGSPKLQHLNISGNRIKDLEALEPLKELRDLVNLDLYNCEVTKTDNYRVKVFDLLPNLHSLDGYDRNEREVADSDESEDEGSDVENRIAREDIDDIDEDDDGESGGSSSDYDEEEDDDDEIETYNGTLNTTNEFSDDETEPTSDDDDDDGDDDDDDDDEEEDDDDELAASGQVTRPSATASAATTGTANEDDSLANGDDNEDDEDDDDDDEAVDDEEGGGPDLKHLQQDIGEDEDSDDDDFEPSHEPDERDFEIDPEDDADGDESSALLSSLDRQTALSDALSTSGLNASSTSIDGDQTKNRGQKRKREDEGGDDGQRF